MKKSSFLALVFGTVSGVLFSLGMCMALLPEWNTFTEGIIFGYAGLIVGLITFLIWCKMEKKKLPKCSGKNEDTFVDAHLTKEGETVEEAKARIKK